MSLKEKGFPYKPKQIPRSVIKWLQGLDLTKHIKSFRRDFANGYLVAEIFHYYYPRYIMVNALFHGQFPLVTGSASKEIWLNWQYIKDCMRRAKFRAIPEPLARAVMYMRDGAAETLVCKLYTALTQRKLEWKDRSGSPMEDFNDEVYQDSLPLICKSTAIMRLRRNVSLIQRELQSYADAHHSAQHAIKLHEATKRRLKNENKAYYSRKATLGQRAVRRLPPPGAPGFLGEDSSDDFAANKAASPPAPSAGFPRSLRAIATMETFPSSDFGDSGGDADSSIDGQILKTSQAFHNLSLAPTSG